MLVSEKPTPSPSDTTDDTDTTIFGVRKTDTGPSTNLLWCRYFDADTDTDQNIRPDILVSVLSLKPIKTKLPSSLLLRCWGARFEIPQDSGCWGASLIYACVSRVPPAEKFKHQIQKRKKKLICWSRLSWPPTSDLLRPPLRCHLSSVTVSILSISTPVPPEDDFLGGGEWGGEWGVSLRGGCQLTLTPASSSGPGHPWAPDPERIFGQSSEAAGGGRGVSPRPLSPRHERGEVKVKGHSWFSCVEWGMSPG